ncbi:MAG TPA: SDR family oxidoreductase [Burkholderiaceae bacterium]
MKILLTGATGFIGSHLRRALLDAGHSLLCTSRGWRRDGPGCQWVVVDFAHVSTARWSELLVGVDAVVNTVGVFRERGDATFASVHGTGARRLFAACVHAGVQRVVQVSALGADAGAASDYHLSKRIADEHLLSMPLDATVVQPSLVFGLDGSSARMLLTWSCLPLVPLPAGGQQMLQPVHVDDVADAVAALLRTRERWRGQRIALVGPVPLALRDYLRTLRAGLGVSGWRVWAVPPAVVSIALRVAGWWPRALFDRAAWQMLERGNCGDASAIAALLGRVPRAANRFIEPALRQAARREAQLGWLLPLLRAALAAVWIATAIVSLGVYPVSDSYALLQRAGVPAAWQPLALYGAAAVDLVLGVLTLLPLRRTRPLWAAQMALIVGYTLIVSLRLPEYWLHPFGPISKNLPLLALLVMLYVMSPSPARR